MLSTENIGLKKPGYNDEADIAIINENMDVIDSELNNRYTKSQTYSNRETDEAIANAINALPNGLVYRGAVNYYKDLPTDNNELGDTYSVKYQGTSGNESDGNEYAWGEYDGTLQWIKLGVNAYNKSEIDEMHAEISEDIEQNKSDILKAENDIAINRATLGTQCKNLFNKDGEINMLFNGTIITEPATKNTVDGNVITFNRNSQKEHLTGQLISNLKGKRLIISFNILSFGTGTSGTFRIMKLNEGTAALETKTYGALGEYTVEYTAHEDSLLFVFGISSTPNTGKGLQIENLMIRYADITDDTYEEYKPSLQKQIDTLVSEIAELKANLTQTE